MSFLWFFLYNLLVLFSLLVSFWLLLKDMSENVLTFSVGAEGRMRCCRKSLFCRFPISFFRLSLQSSEMHSRIVGSFVNGLSSSDYHGVGISGSRYNKARKVYEI